MAMVQNERSVTTPAPSDPSSAPRDRLSTTAFVLGLASALTGVLYFVAVPSASPAQWSRDALAPPTAFAVWHSAACCFLSSDHRRPRRHRLLVLDGDGSDAIIVDGVESGTRDVSHPPQHDLDPGVTCASDSGALRASGQLTNRTDEVADYQLIATWERNGRGIAQATALVDQVEPGATRPWEVMAVGDDTPGVLVCGCIDRG
jgi:hypothetical protein